VKGVRFYLDYGSKRAKRKGGPAPNALVLIVENGFQPAPYPGGYGTWEAVVALTEHADSPVCGSSVSAEYLRESCKRTSEEKARETHPQMAAYLDRLSEQWRADSEVQP
jgi:hypothetical protein